MKVKELQEILDLLHPELEVFLQAGKNFKPLESANPHAICSNYCGQYDVYDASLDWDDVGCESQDELDEMKEEYKRCLILAS